MVSFSMTKAFYIAFHMSLVSSRIVDRGYRPPFTPVSINNPLQDQCPPCFDCNSPVYPCLNFGNCSGTTGKCVCSTGFGSNDCSQPRMTSYTYFLLVPLQKGRMKKYTMIVCNLTENNACHHFQWLNDNLCIVCSMWRSFKSQQTRSSV